MATTKPKVNRPSHGLKSDEVPAQFREVFITSGYRKPYISAMECLKSVFQPLNETVNVWTHFLPFLLFVVRFSLVFTQSSFGPFNYPLLSFAIGICGFCLMSSGAHLFNCMSPRVRHVCFFFDYAAISVYAVGAGQAFFFYTRPLESSVPIFNSAALFLSISTTISFASTFTCCASRHRWAKLKYIIRTGAFVVAFVFNSSPYLYRIVTEDGCGQTAAATYFKRHCLFYLISALANMSRMPERYFPGVFDIVGQSHNLLHVFTALGAADQFTSIQMQAEERRATLDNYQIATFGSSLGLMLIICACNVGIVLWFGKNLKSDKEEEHKEL